MTDLFVIDYGPMEDLMFWSRFARLLNARGADASPAMILLGSGEKTEGLLGGPGAAPRTNGSLPSGGADARKIERGMREELQSVVAQLTDEGISAVGFSGLDRNLLRVTGEDEGRIEVGERALRSATRWTGSGVIPVISCIATCGEGCIRDVHPATVASGVADALTNARIILVAQRLTKPLRDAASGENGSAVAFSDAALALAEPDICRRVAAQANRVHLVHPDLGDLRSPPALRVPTSA